MYCEGVIGVCVGDWGLCPVCFAMSNGEIFSSCLIEETWDVGEVVLD